MGDVVRNVHAGPPTRVTRLPDGRRIKEKLCSIRFHYLAVDPDGNYGVAIPLANGKTNRTLVNNLYANLIIERKEAAGFLFLHKCPYAGAVPLPENNTGKGKITPCEGIDGHGTLVAKGQEHKASGCDHHRAIAAVLKAVKAKDEASRVIKSTDQELVELFKADLVQRVSGAA